MDAWCCNQCNILVDFLVTTGWYQHNAVVLSVLTTVVNLAWPICSVLVQLCACKRSFGGSCIIVVLQVTVDRPDVQGRVRILKVHSRGKQIGKDVDFEKIARRTPGKPVVIVLNVYLSGFATMFAGMLHPQCTTHRFFDCHSDCVVNVGRVARSQCWFGCGGVDPMLLSGGGLLFALQGPFPARSAEQCPHVVFQATAQPLCKSVKC